mgnify:CR=1 FL=1
MIASQSMRKPITTKDAHDAVRDYLRTIGAIGGSVKSEKKARAARKNAKKRRKKKETGNGKK